MADFSWTDTDVLPVSGGSQSVAKGGEAIDAGSPVYLNTSSQKYFKADANVSGTYKGVVDGVALTSVAADGAPFILGKGDMTIYYGSGVFSGAGVPVFLSATAGKIAPAGDLASGSNVTLVGVSTSTTSMRLFISATGITKA